MGLSRFDFFLSREKMKKNAFKSFSEIMVKITPAAQVTCQRSPDLQ